MYVYLVVIEDDDGNIIEIDSCYSTYNSAEVIS